VVRLFPGLTVDQLTAAGLTGPHLTGPHLTGAHLTGAHLTDLLEHSDGPPLPVTAGAALVDVPAAGTVTLVLSPQAAPAPDGQRPADPAAPPEPAQPVYTRYWLHGKGPAPAGNLPVAVHLSPGRVALGPAGSGALRLTVACGPAPASGDVTLDVPAGLVVTAGGSSLRYELAGDGHACWQLAVRAAPDAGPGRYYLAAAIRDDLGQVLEDAALVTVGEPGAPALDLPLAELLPLLVADEQLAAAELGLRLAPATLRVGAGGQGELVAEISNRTAAPIRGECQLLSPHGSWPLLGRWTGGFAVGPGEIARLRYPFRLPPHARPGSHWWALAKVMYFGRVRYSECARIEVNGRAGRAGRRRPSPAGRTRRSR
jgi:hypothetical protein